MISSTSNQNLLSATTKLTKLWIPVNKTFLKNIKQGIVNGVYDLDIDFLIKEIESDYGLFTYCLKEIWGMAQKGKLKLDKFNDPQEVFRFVGLEVLEKIIDQALEKLTDISTVNKYPEQTAKIQESMISAIASEVLSKKDNLNPERSFAIQIIKNLGIILVAFNFPQLYADGIKKYKTQRELEHYFTLQLGFSPRLLSIAFARKWFLPLETHYLIGDKSFINSLSQANQLGVLSSAKEISIVIKLSDELAKISNPLMCEDVKSKWQELERIITEKYGLDTLSEISNEIKNKCNHYIELNPESFKALDNFSPSKIIDNFYQQSLFSKNHYIKHCDAKMQDALKQLYLTINNNKESKYALDLLINDVFNATPFLRGVIYVKSENKNILIPRLVFGQIDKEEINLKPVVISAINNPNDIINNAFNCNAPITLSEGGLFFDSKCSIASIIGKKTKLGVLYLEPKDTSYRNFDRNNMLPFKAFLESLSEILTCK